MLICLTYVSWTYCYTDGKNIQPFKNSRAMYFFVRVSWQRDITESEKKTLPRQISPNSMTESFPRSIKSEKKGVTWAKQQVYTKCRRGFHAWVMTLFWPTWHHANCLRGKSGFPPYTCWDWRTRPQGVLTEYPHPTPLLEVLLLNSVTAVTNSDGGNVAQQHYERCL